MKGNIFGTLNRDYSTHYTVTLLRILQHGCGQHDACTFTLFCTYCTYELRVCINCTVYSSYTYICVLYRYSYTVLSIVKKSSSCICSDKSRIFFASPLVTVYKGTTNALLMLRPYDVTCIPPPQHTLPISKHLVSWLFN